MSERNYSQRIGLTLIEDIFKIPNPKYTERLFRYMTLYEVIKKGLWGEEKYPIYRIKIKSNEN